MLVVIGIIALLISILLPALGKARDAANKAACLSNEKQVVAAILMYVGDNKGYLPGPAVPFVFDPYTTNPLPGAPVINGVAISQLSVWNSTSTYYEYRELSSINLMQRYLGGVGSRNVWFCPASTDIRNAVDIGTGSGGVFTGKQPGYGYRINNDASDTNCSPEFLFGSYTASDTVANQTPKKVVSIQVLASEVANPDGTYTYLRDPTRVWLVSDLDGRNASVSVSASFGITPAATTTAAKNLVGFQPVHRGNKTIPNGLGRNYAYLDGHAEFKLFSDWPGETGLVN